MPTGAGTSEGRGRPAGPSDRSIYARYYLSLFLAVLLNPRALAQLLLQSGGQVLAAIRGYGPRASAAPVSMRLPFRGTWKVHRGGTSRETSHSWSVLAQRFAFDFTREGSSTSEDERFRAFGAFAEPVLAPADGTVIAMRDGARDHRRPGTGWIAVFCPDIRGNWVCIDHGGVYSFTGHLRCGSVKVRAGEHVRAGQQIGDCGNSGHSTEPHIHFHLQDRASFYLGIGVPLRFEDGRIEPAAPRADLDHAMPQTGDRVTAGAEPPLEPATHSAKRQIERPVGGSEIGSSVVNFSLFVVAAVAIVRMVVRLLLRLLA